MTKMTGAKIQGISPTFQMIQDTIICPSLSKAKAFFPSKETISIQDMVYFLRHKKHITHFKIPFNESITTFVFGCRDHGAIEAVVFRNEDKNTIVFTDSREVELTSLNQLYHYKPFVQTLCVS